MPTVDELLEKAERFAEQQRWEEASQVARQAVQLAPGTRWAKDKLGWYLSRSKNYSDAIAVYTELNHDAPDNPKYAYMLGYQYYDQQNFVDAIPWFNRALELKPDYLVVLYRCGYAQLQTQNLREAERLFRKCVALWRGLDDDEAKQREKQTYADACFQLGKIHGDVSDWDRAIQAFNEAVSYDTDDADKLYNLGKALVKRQRYGEALDVLVKADQIAPRKHYIQTYLAVAYHQLNRVIEAERIFNAIPARIKDQFPYIWQHHAELYLAQGRNTDVIHMLRAATRKPNNKGLHSWYSVFVIWAEACERIDDVIGAYQAYRQANDWHQQSRGKPSAVAMQRQQELVRVAAERGLDLNEAIQREDKPADIMPSHEGVAHIKKFFVDRGFGFIEQPTGGDLFVHIRNVVNPEAIREGASVEYQIGQGRKGPEAVEVHVLE